MRPIREKFAGPDRHGFRRRGLAAALTAISVLATLGAAAPAMASLKQDLLRFGNCPYDNPLVTTCLYSVANSGEFVIGKSSVPISKPVVIQAGLKALGVFQPATNGETLSKTALPVPGGLVGIELPGNFTEVTATAELAGQAQLANSITLPLKVKLDNLALGSNCYIGSEAEPLALSLTYGTTSPPPPNKPISGKLAIAVIDRTITQITGTLVDNAFAAPAARGCTLLPLVGDLAVNTKEGLPAGAGQNTAIMNGVTEEVPARTVRAILPLPDLGRCLKVEPTAEGKRLVYHGVYTNATCTAESEEKAGRYEWSPGPGANAAFTGEGRALTLETTGKQSVTCSASSVAGQYTGPKSSTASLTLTGCQIGPKGKGVACQSSGAGAGEIRSATLNGNLDFIKENEEPATPIVGVGLKPAAGTPVLGFACAGKAASVDGSLVVPVTTLDRMSASFKLKASASGGVQSPESFEVGPKQVLTYRPSGGPEEQAGLTTAVTANNAEPVEIKAIP